MKDRLEIILSGVGGQGLILSGTILGDASIADNKNATLSSSYGVETRGTFAKSDLIVSNNDIHYTEVTKPNIVLTMEQVAYDKYASSLDENTVIIYDSSLVSKVIETKAKQYGFPITTIARDLGNVTIANIVAVGIIVKMTELVSEEVIINTFKKYFSKKPKVLELNVKAFNEGLNLIQ